MFLVSFFSFFKVFYGDLTSFYKDNSCTWRLFFFNFLKFFMGILNFSFFFFTKFSLSQALKVRIKLGNPNKL